MLHRISLDEGHADWERAIERAVANDCELRISHVATEYAPGLGWESVFTVWSASTPRKRYTVQLLVDGDERTATCDCVAAEHGRRCWHMAGCALIAGLIIQPAPADQRGDEPVTALKRLRDEPPTAPEPPKERDIAETAAYILRGDHWRDLMAGQLA